MCKYSRIIRNLQRRVRELENQLQSSGLITQSGTISVTANQPFPNSWHTSGRLSDLITDINNDSDATKGKIYLSTVSFDDLPGNMMQAEMKVEIMNEGKIMLFTITSENVAPYHWEATSAYGRAATWRSFVNN